jgi:DNA-binding XRE family transcriptional regulator
MVLNRWVAAFVDPKSIQRRRQEKTRPLRAWLSGAVAGMLTGKFPVAHGASPLSKFGKNLVRLRSGLPITQERLAELAEIHPRYLQKLESGKAHPSLVVLSKLRAALKCEWNDLLKQV